MLRVSVGYPLGYSINMFLGLALGNYFGPLEGYLVGVSIVPLYVLMIVTGEEYFVVLILVIPRVSQLEAPNPIAELPGTLMDAPLGLWFLSCAVWGVGISCVPPYGDLITSNMTSVRYCQLLEFLTLALSTTWLISSSGWRLRAAELASSGSIPFTLGIYEYSSIFTDDMSS